MFNENSMVVRAWVDKSVKRKTTEEVPNLSNLIDVVTTIIEGQIICLQKKVC